MPPASNHLNNHNFYLHLSERHNGLISKDLVKQLIYL